MATPTITKYPASTLPEANWNYQSVTAELRKDNVMVFESKTRLAQYVVYDGEYPRMWSVVLHYMSYADKDALVNLWLDRQGRAKPFKWVNPNDFQTYYVHFGDQDLKLERLPVAGGGWRASFTLIEAHSLEIDTSA